MNSIPDFFIAHFLNPGDCIIQGFRIRRVPIQSVLNIVNSRGIYEMDAYHFGFSANGRYISYSHIIRIDHVIEGPVNYTLLGQNSPLPELRYEVLYDTLWYANFYDQPANKKMMDEVTEVFDSLVNSTYMNIGAIEIDQNGLLLNRFDFNRSEFSDFDIATLEERFISWIELPIFSIYISELPPE